MRSSENASVGSYVTFFNSPDFYNPTQTRLDLLRDSGGPTLSSKRQQILLEAALGDTEIRVDRRRDRAVKEVLSHIPEEDRRQAVHLQAIERALFEWRKQAGGPKPVVDQETCRKNITRLLSEISRLRSQA